MKPFIQGAKHSFPVANVSSMTLVPEQTKESEVEEEDMSTSALGRVMRERK